MSAAYTLNERDIKDPKLRCIYWPQANPIMVFYPLQREVSLKDTKVYQLPSLFMSTLLHNLNYSIEIESSKAVATLRRLIKKESRCGT